MIRTTLFTALILFHLSTFSQSNYESLFEEAETIFNTNPTKSDLLLDSILYTDSIAIPLDIRVNTLRLKGVRSTYSNKFDIATSYFNRSLSLLNYLDNEVDKKTIKAKIFLNQGKNLLWQSKYDTALSILLNAREMFEAQESHKYQAQAMNDIAIIYIQYSNENQKGLEAFREALRLYSLANETASAAKTMQNLGQIHNMMGSNDSALFYLKKSNSLVEELKDYRSLAVGNNMLGAIYNDLEQFDSSEFYFRKAIDMDLINQDSIGLLYDYFQLSETLNAMGKYREAKKYGILAYDYSKSVHLKIGAAKSLVEINASLEDYKTSLEYHRNFKALSDSLMRQDQRRSVSELQTKFETVQKEKEIQETKAELESEQRFKQFLMILIGVVLLFSAVAIYLLFQRFKIKRELLSQEIDTLRLQINSVFGGGVTDLNLTIDKINEGLYKPLSDREFEILNHALSDKNNRQIAETVFVSVSTVKFHLRNIYEKLGVSNRKEALEAILAKT